VVLLISYDLRSPQRPSAYEAVEAAITGAATSSFRALYSLWLVETEESPVLWRDRLLDVIAGDGSFLICPVYSYSGYLPSDVWPWLQARV
jgi:hypothetical protein